MTTTDKREALLVRLLAAHSDSYDITKQYRFEGKTFPGYAEFHSCGEQYVLVKRAKLWEVHTHEFLFVDVLDALNEEVLSEAIAFMKQKAFRKVPAGPNHMSSAISLVIITTSATDGAVQLIRKTRFRTSYRMSFHGWADLGLALVDLSRPNGKQVITNTAGKRLGSVLKSNLALLTNE